MSGPRPTRLSDAELDQLAQVHPEDIERARLAWERGAPPEFRHLLEATLDDREV